MENKIEVINKEVDPALIEPNTASIIKYETDTGRITGIISGTPDMVEANKHGTYLDGTADPLTQYVKDGAIVDRPVQDTELIDITLMGLPVPSIITIEGETYDCDEEEAELEIEVVGTYSVKVESWPYLDKEFTLTIKG